MKKIIIAATLVCFSSISVMAQQDHSSHQNQTSVSKSDTIKLNLTQLLTLYYDIKDALVKGNANLASTKGEEFVKIANGIDYKVISEGNINALLKDADKISETRDLTQQRKFFASLSDNMFALAKALKLSTQPIYQAYCPMKKAYWLSREKDIKNPYFGSAMLTCGSITQTL